MVFSSFWWNRWIKILLLSLFSYWPYFKLKSWSYSRSSSLLLKQYMKSFLLSLIKFPILSQSNDSQWYQDSPSKSDKHTHNLAYPGERIQVSISYRAHCDDSEVHSVKKWELLFVFCILKRSRLIELTFLLLLIHKQLWI